MVDDTEKERFFRESYALELRKMKQVAGKDELQEEKNNVKQQEMKTPGRRGEQIKYEEIDREIVRRYGLKQEKNRV